MRLTVPVVQRNGRRPALEPFKFKEILPLSLKDSISGKGDKSSDVVCLQEMAVMLACLKVHDFRGTEICSKEVSSFQKCFQDFKAAQKNNAKLQQEGFVGVGVKKLPYQQVNRILANYPQPK